mmetsp:Transcript_33563/g.107234  ORF Transcript_33563/g.107234 Transcript_33563/m.107234 type:complete len:762 (-) Transcript_33563:196-2481(-)
MTASSTLVHFSLTFSGDLSSAMARCSSLVMVGLVVFSTTAAAFATLGGTTPHHRGHRRGLRPPPAAATMEEKVASDEESFEFSADVSRVMEIIINSLYSDKAVFLRELVSNAADACDKKRFLGITEKKNQIDGDLKIRITPNKDDNTLTIEDGGIGMSKEELVNNLGKIAQSGTKKFAEALKESSSKGEGSVNLIGQFGVGFYSGFLVADKMTVYTKQADDDKVYVWESNAKNGFTVSETAASSEELLTLGGSSASSSSGTKIVLTLKEDTRTEYLDDYNLRNLLRKYSEFVNFPIELFTKTTTYNKEGNETKPIEKMEYQVVNSQEPLWLRSPKDVNQSEYAGFYKTAFRQFDEPLRSSHFALEGQVQFRALLFLPSVLPFELSRNMFDENLRNMKLYVKRVFINDQFGEDLLPRWLTFMKGLVDSEDLPLNVGREILQKSKVLTIIKKRLVRKSLDMFNDVARNGTDYETFWKNYGRYLKIGTVEEQGQIQKDIAKLCRFSSTKSDFTSFDELVARQKESHPEDTESTKRILFVSGEGKKAAESSPALERLKKENYEVLLLTEPLDELVMQAVGNFEGFTLVDAAKGDIFSSDAAAKGQDPFGGGPSDDDDPAWDPVKKVFSDALGKKIQKVSMSKRLTDSPAALVQGAYGMSPMMQRYMNANAAALGGGDPVYGVSAPTMELNPDHPVVKDLQTTKDPDTALLIYDLAALTSGYDVDDTAAFSKRVNELLVKQAASPEEKTQDDDDDEPAIEPEVIVD